MDIKQLFIQTNQLLNDTVQKITPEQLSIIMPKYASFHDGQTLQTHLQICAHENACVPRMLAGEEGIPSNSDFKKDYLGDDFKENFDKLTKFANDAVMAASEEDLDKIVHMSYGDAPARDYLKDIVIQRSTAALDIAHVAGITLNWSEDLVVALWSAVLPYADTLREYGIFPPAVTVGDDAPLQDKLIAIMGRQP